MTIKNIFLASIFLTGCVFKIEPTKYNHPKTDSAEIKAVLVGVENGFAGKCIGSLKDVQIMSSMLNECGVTQIVSLVDTQATFQNVKIALENASNAELMIFYYSGHGGSLPTTNLVNEVDGYDECLCLYDTIMKDDQIWEIISKCKNKAFLIFDSCHSQTMFRSPMISMANNSPILFSSSNSNNTFSMLCWSGCPDDYSSYGSSNGGFFTTTIKKYFRSDVSYEQIWKNVKNDRTLKKKQTCVCTEIGKSFSGNSIFR